MHARASSSRSRGPTVGCPALERARRPDGRRWEDIDTPGHRPACRRPLGLVPPRSPRQPAPGSCRQPAPTLVRRRGGRGAARQRPGRMGTAPAPPSRSNQVSRFVRGPVRRTREPVVEPDDLVELVETGQKASCGHEWTQADERAPGARTHRCGSEHRIAYSRSSRPPGTPASGPRGRGRAAPPPVQAIRLCEAIRKAKSAALSRSRHASSLPSPTTLVRGIAFIAPADSVLQAPTR
jgi:hypothetical protein